MKSIQDILDLENEIKGLQRYALELYNDYDFTHGEPELFVKVFGPDVKAPE